MKTIVKFSTSQMKWDQYKYTVTDSSYAEEDIRRLIKSGEIERHTTPLGKRIIIDGGKEIGTWDQEYEDVDKEEVQSFD